jgi:uncharacterized RDD family membrane protein YckC
MSTPTDEWNKGWDGQLSIDTPELISLQFSLAGVGSRGIAVMLDYLIQAAAYLLAMLGLVALGSATGSGRAHAANSPNVDKWVVAILILIPFMLHWAYFTLFEALWDGRTPGKRMMRLRVIQQNGRSLTFFESMIRNLIRIVDALPSFYAVGIISVFATKRQQRLGDMAAGTIVIHEAKQESSLWNGTGARSFTATIFDPPVVTQTVVSSGLPVDAIARLTAADLTAIDSFLARRLDVPMDVRERLAGRLAQQLRMRMQVESVGLRNEALIESVEREMRSAGQL